MNLINTIKYFIRNTILFINNSFNINIYIVIDKSTITLVHKLIL